MTQLKWLPIACTLAPAALKARLAEISTLSRDALTDYEQRDLTMMLRYRPEAASQVRQMVAGEQQCCAFLEFDVKESAEEVRVTVVAPEGSRGAAMELFAQFIPSSAAP